jgi:hypothetical protein
LLCNTDIEEDQTDDEPAEARNEFWGRWFFRFGIGPNQMTRQGGTRVESRFFEEKKIKSSQPFLLRKTVPGPGWTVYQAPVRSFRTQMDFWREAEMEDGSCPMGVLVGLCLEGVMAVGVYGIWELWQLLR